MPEPATITFADCIAQEWRVHGHCERCRMLTQLRLHLIPKAMLTEPIDSLWRRGKLICRVHRTPLDAVTVDIGYSILGETEGIAEWRRVP